MKLIATLACRNNSNRLYGKPLQILGGQYTILEYMLNRLKERSEIHDIVLAISEARGNEGFLDIAESNRVKYVLGDDRDVLLRLIKACDLAKGDTVFRVTTESPFTYLEGLPVAMKSHLDKKADYTTYAKLPDGVSFELINLEALKKSHREGSSKHRSELCTLYINENPQKFNINILDVEEQYQRPDYRLTIDYPEDLILCRKIVQHFNAENRYIPYPSLIKYLDENPEVRAIVENITDVSYVKPYH